MKGQGPEHSSARLERFLQLSAENEYGGHQHHYIRQLFHAAPPAGWPFRKPLVNFSPKANLRLQASYSHIGAFTQGGFKEVIDDAFVSDAGQVKKVLFCSGKVYSILRSDSRRKTARMLPSAP
jgi:2-oxoglutarate dehydrogenase E1 component